MRTQSGARAGAFLAQAPRRKGLIATAIELYSVHSGFRFLSNFVFFGGLTLVCLSLSSNLSLPQAGGSSFNLGALLPSAGARVMAPAEATSAPTVIAEAANDANTPITTQKAAALIQALGPAADATPPAPLLTDYKIAPAVTRNASPDGPTGQLMAGMASIQRGGTANVETGFVLLKRAADSGLPAAEALYGLARLAPPSAVPADTGAGREWLQKAAEGGDAQAARILARAYLTGAAGFADPEKAQAFYRRAHDLGDVSSSLALAALIARGVGGVSDPAQAEQLIRIGADHSDPQAMSALGRYLTLAAVKGWSPSFDEAILWLTRSADQGDLSAMEQLGDIHMYLAKSAPAQDPSAGFGWYQRCATGGRAACHFAVGRAYALALGTSGDLAQAWAHLSLARDAGQPKAAEALATVSNRIGQAQLAQGVRLLADLKNPTAR